MQVVDLSQQAAAHGGAASGKNDHPAGPQFQSPSTGSISANHDQGVGRSGSNPDHSIQLRPHRAVALGDTLLLELGENVTVAARVIWTSGSDCGVKFEHPVDYGALIAGLAALSHSDLRTLDSSHPSSVAIRRGDFGTSPDSTTDTAAGGMKPVYRGSFVEGLAVKVSMPSGPDRRGIVCWSEANIARVIVLEPIAAETSSFQE